MTYLVVLRIQQFVPLVSLILVGLGVSGQGAAWSEEPQVSAASANAAQSIMITMESYIAKPQRLSAEVGQPSEILLTNESFLIPHNCQLDSPDGVRLIEANVDSGEQPTIQFTPTQSGAHVFYYNKQLLFSPDHREEGMEGPFTVR